MLSLLLNLLFVHINLTFVSNYQTYCHFTIMPHQTSCMLVHPDTQAGPCKLCMKHDISGRYVHLCQREQASADWFIEHYDVGLLDCICRRCFLDGQRRKLSAMAMPQNQPIPPPPLPDEGCCTTPPEQSTSSATNDNEMHQEKDVIEHSDENKACTCLICERGRRKREKVIFVSNSRHLDKLYGYCEFVLDLSIPMINDSCFLCMRCYNLFLTYCNQPASSDNMHQSKQFVENVYRKACQEIVDNTDHQSYAALCTLKHLCKTFLDDGAILLPDLYDTYTSKLVSSPELKLHSPDWLLRLMKQSLGPALKVYTPSQKSQGRMLYRYGSESSLLSSLHSVCFQSRQKVSKLAAENNDLQSRLNRRTNQTTDITTITALNHVTKILRENIQCYTKENSFDAENIPDLRNFKAMEEVQKIHPVLWNLIFRITCTAQEEKELNKDLFDWKSSYTVNMSNERILQRLYILSCIFHSYSSHCHQPLHLLLTDLADKFTNSSTAYLTLNARLGAGVSKDTLQRYISLQSITIANQHKTLSSGRFAIASFDNIDKNQKYSLVSVDRDHNGFHGTTVQAVEPIPITGSLSADEKPEEEISFQTSPDNTMSLKDNHRSRTVPTEITRAMTEPEDKVGLPSENRVNKFANMTLDSIGESSSEEQEMCSFHDNLFLYSVIKSVSNNTKFIFPGLKCFLSETAPSTEKSKFHYIAVLDENADSKETIIKVLNILHEKFQIHREINHLVIVGDGKSYDLLIKLKNEYGDQLSWVLAYPGDWHILKNFQSVLFKIYLDAGLKELAMMHHHGATLKSLIECTSFALTNRFLLQIWEAIYRYQIILFFQSENVQITSFSSDLNQYVINAISQEDLSFESESDDVDEVFIKHVISSSNCLFSSKVSAMKPQFTEWREKMCSCNQTFRFWDSFVHRDVMAYIGLYIGIRGRNWDLRNSSLRTIACLFYAFDRLNYSRMIPYHLADLKTFPPSVLKHFRNGGFSVSVSGESFHSVAVDESHEMEINLKVKGVLNSVSQESLASMTHYLPYRAETLHNIKTELNLAKDESNSHHRESTSSYMKSAEATIRSYISKLNLSSLFSVDYGENLLHIFSQKQATVEQVDSLLNYHKYGTEDLENYLSCVLFKVSDLSAKLPVRKRRNLKTFTEPKKTVYQQSKEIKDTKTVISCLRKKIAYSKLTGQPINSLEQFIRLPRAIADAEGYPNKGQKSKSTHCLQAFYKDAFLVSLQRSADISTVILEGMFMINTVPNGSLKTFADYAVFLYNRWIKHSFQVYDAAEVHVVFDNPKDVSLKNLERERRDQKCSSGLERMEKVSSNAELPANWHKFLADRVNKRLLINFLSYYFLEISASSCAYTFVTAGGFDDENKDKAICTVNGILGEYILASSNHEESDSRVWVHTQATTATRVVIYSPDTDTYFIGLPLIQNMTGKQIYIQLKDSPYQKVFIDMNALIDQINHDLLLQSVESKEKALQMLYIVSGCDYVSYFRGYGKKSFIDSFRQNASFISGEEFQLSSFDPENGLLSFYRLIASVYFKKHAVAFQPYKSVKALFMASSNVTQSPLEQHITLITTIRECLWDRIISEDEIIPSPDALRFHWLRCCYVYNMFSQACSNNVVLPPVDQWGWEIQNGKIKVVWDTDQNFEAVDKNVDWFRKGCACKTGCTTKRCKCVGKVDGQQFCGPGCRCTDCRNIPIKVGTSVVDMDAELEEGQSDSEMICDMGEMVTGNEMEI